ncbi:MAG: hypothetical protein HOV87_11440 [Catenulispora sp.]|nr:hypothetical protein [Catenulispora sp.]
MRSVTAVAMAAGAVVSASGTVAAAAPAGRVCMVDAPDGALGFGHVAWSYRDADGSGWDYGATLQSHNWRRHGSEQQMLHDFATMDESGGYRTYRCTDTAADDQRAADAKVVAGFARPYSLATDNCLTRAIEIFKAYDRSGGLNGLEPGRFTFPNAYFNYELTGWGPETKL